MSEHLQLLSTFVADTAFRQLPPSLIEQAKRHLLDTLGAALAGCDSDIWRQCVALAREEAGNGSAQLWGSADEVTPRQAAWLNGVAAHMYELDDTGGCDHSGAVVVPALLAALPLAAQPVSGEALLTAMVVGYDVGRRVLEACGGYEPHNEAGWHSTATCGVFGAAAAVCSLLRLTPAQCASALGIAASFSGGLWAFIHDGSQTKKLHAGRAAESGLQAALLAGKGITGPGAIFDDRWGGFLRTIAPESQQPDALAAGLGEIWKLARCSIKPYASCRGTHSAIDALSNLLTAHPEKKIARVRVRLNPFLMSMCGGRELASLAAAQMSLPYALTARWLYHDAGLESYSETRRLSKEAAAMMERIELEIDETQGNNDEPVVMLETQQGECWQEHVPVPSGSPANPLSDQALFAKYQQLAQRILPAQACQHIYDLCMHLEHVTDVRELSRSLKR
ncbi:MmgE/PrpD family protein [Affinibrenneria salicis]|uniref:MmgE/PrpD family protein n=1 Tax=Affinibrenneria salicis TaxID=2590031 RepID=A0A5J5G1T7_9GAMM|nr:MmgE/PrpD family protein [Affinibrenneria salicis]KAA9000452.1 MmgE/PrpD family protein [Affinibrenneria salicis]